MREIHDNAYVLHSCISRGYFISRAWFIHVYLLDLNKTESVIIALFVSEELLNIFPRRWLFNQRHAVQDETNGWLLIESPLLMQTVLTRPPVRSIDIAKASGLELFRLVLCTTQLIIISM